MYVTLQSRVKLRQVMTLVVWRATQEKLFFEEMLQMYLVEDDDRREGRGQGRGITHWF